MSLKYLKSFTDCQTKNKPRNEQNKGKFKKFHSEVYDISPCKQKREQPSLKSESPKSEIVNENLSELLNMLTCAVIKKKIPKTLKIKSKEIDPHKRVTNESHHISHKVNFEPKKEKKDKAYPIIKRETSNKNKDFAVKQIPFNNANLLEFSIDRSHCPMVVRIHRGYPNRSKSKKESETLRSRALTRSLSCPLKIDDQLKIASASRTSEHKKKKGKSKCGLMSHGYTICEFLNLSPRKSGVHPKDGNLEMFTDIDNTERLSRKKVLKNKSKLQRSSVNVKMCNCYTDSMQYQKKRYSTNESIKPQNIIVKNKCNEQNTVLTRLEVKDDYNYDNPFSSAVTYNQYMSKKYGPFTKISAMRVKEEDEEFGKDLVNKHCDGEAIQMEKSSLVDLKTKDFMMQKNIIDHEKLYLQNHAQGEMPHVMDIYCQKCEKDHIPVKDQTHNISSQTASYAPATTKVFSNTGYDNPHEGLKLENITAKKISLLNNVVTLDASQSQFYKISEFFKDNTISKGNKNTNNSFSKLSLSSQNSSLAFDDQGHIKNTLSKGSTKKPRSEKQYLHKYTDMNNYNKHSDNEQSEPCLPQPKYNSSFTTSKTYPYKTADKIVFNKLKNNFYSSSYKYECMGCNKVVCKIENFDPYCSDCKLKIKLSKISNESSSTNSDIELKDRLSPSVKALTIIPESDISLSKTLVSVAIQTDCDLEQDRGQNMKPHDTENNTNPSHSLENIFKMYCSIEAQFNKEQGPTKIKESLLRSNNNNDLLYEKNLFGVDFKKQKQELEPDNHLSEQNPLYLKYNASRRSSHKVDSLMCCMPKAMEPNIQNYRENTSSTYIPKFNFTSNENIGKNQVKTSLSSFISPIFPQKEYCRITCNNHKPHPVLKSSKEIFSISKCAMNEPLDHIPQTYEHKLRSDINVQSQPNENSEALKHFLIQRETSPRKVVKSVEGPYVSHEKIITSRPEEIKNINYFKYSTEENSLEAVNNGLSFCKRGTAIPGLLSRDRSFSVMNIKDSTISLNNKFKISVDECHEEKCKANTMSTLVGAIEDQNLKYHSSCQFSQIQNLNKDATHCYMTSHIICRNYQQEPELISKQGSNCLNNEMLMKILTSNDETNCLQQTNCPKKINYLNNKKAMFFSPLYERFNLSKGDLNTQLKHGIHSSQIECDRGRMEGISQNDHRKAKTCIISFRDAEENRKYSESKQKAESCKVGSETTDILELHSFSYILFNISVHNKENISPSSDAEESYKNHISFQTGLVLMPEKTGKADNDNLNDVILGSKFKTQINRRLMIKETNIKKANVFELSSLSMLSEGDTGEGSDCHIYNSEKDNLENRPTTYKAISPSIEVNESKYMTEILKKVDDAMIKQKSLDSPLLEPDFEKNKKHGRTCNNTLQKMKSRNPKEKMTNSKRSKEERNTFMKINKLFMSSYMTQLSFFHDLQSVFRITKTKAFTLK